MSGDSMSLKLIEIMDMYDKSTVAKEQIPYTPEKFKKILMFLPDEMVEKIYAALILEQQENE